MEDDNYDVAEILSTVGVFSSVATEIVEQLARRSAIETISAGEWLFREGEPSECLYVVLSGRCEVVAELGGGARRLRLLGPGDAVGELGVLTRSPRSASVRALRDSALLRTPRLEIELLYDEAPGFAIAMVHAMSSHLWHRWQPEATAGRNAAVAVLVDGDHVPAADCRRLLTTSLRALCDVGVVEDDPALDAAGRGRSLDKSEREHDLSILFAPLRTQDDWWRFCVRQADSVVVVSACGASPPVWHETRSARVALAGSRSDPRVGRWLTQPWVTEHHHLEDKRRWESGFDRLARSLLGKSVGLVLSGGGARGFAHIGVLQALGEAGLAVDRIGGCSMGALVAGLYANGSTPDEIRRICRRELVLHNPFRDYTLPRASVLRARLAELMLRRVFGEGLVEATAIPCFTVSCDLVGADIVVHRRGPLYWAVGVSMNLPGLVPPVLDDGKILVDGGVLDNLPVDHMPKAAGPVIAVDVMTKGWHPRMVAWERRPGTAGIRAHASLLAGRGPERVPSLAETLARTTVIGSWRMAVENRAKADILITPDVGNAGVLDFRRLDEMVEAGRAAGQAALADLREAGLVAAPTSQLARPLIDR